MKEKRSKEKHRKSHKKDKKRNNKKRCVSMESEIVFSILFVVSKFYILVYSINLFIFKSSDSSSTSSDEWIEKVSTGNPKTDREDWMAMTGMLKTYTKDDIRPKKEDNDKKHSDSYNPSTSSRELNPYWKDGGSGVPQTAENFRQSVKFLKPADDDDYYTKSSHRKSITYSHTEDKPKSRHYKPADDDDYYYKSSRSDTSSYKNDSKKFQKPLEDDEFYRKSSSSSSKRHNRHEDEHHERYSERKSYNWKNSDKSSEPRQYNQSYNEAQESNSQVQQVSEHRQPTISNKPAPEKSEQSSKYLSDEKMNKLGAKIVKAEIMGDTKLVTELKEKLEAAREYRKQNPDAKPDEENEDIMLIATNSFGNSRPLTNTSKGDARSKGGKRKADTHMSGERAKYFGNDDKYNLAEMVSTYKLDHNNHVNPVVRER